MDSSDSDSDSDANSPPPPSRRPPQNQTYSSKPSSKKVKGQPPTSPQKNDDTKRTDEPNLLARKSDHIEENSRKQNLAIALSAIEKLVRHMVTNKIGLMQVFRGLDQNNDGRLSKEEVVTGLLKLADVEMSDAYANALAEYMDLDGSGEIDVGEMSEALKRYKKNKKGTNMTDSTMNGKTLISDDVIFPPWLITRRDFRLVFTRFQQENEYDHTEQVLKSLRVSHTSRTHENLQLISSWLEKVSAFTGLGMRRLNELSKTVHFLEVEKGEVLVRQGDVGDAFYLIFSGQVAVKIDENIVGHVIVGQGFGERSLETDEPRSATCIALEKCQFIVVKSHEYKLMIKLHAAKKFKNVMSFLQADVEILKSWTYPKLFRLSGRLVRRSFQQGNVITKQGETATTMYIIYRGRVSLQKEVHYNSSNRWPSFNNSYTVITHDKLLALHLKNAVMGDCFGEELILGYPSRQYSAVALDANVEVFAINVSDMLSFFTNPSFVDHLREESTNLYMTPNELKASHDSKMKQNEIMTDFKAMAFGKRYKNRASIPDKRKGKAGMKRVTPGSLEASVRKINQETRERSVVGVEVSDHFDEDDNTHLLTKHVKNKLVELAEKAKVSLLQGMGREDVVGVGPASVYTNAEVGVGGRHPTGGLPVLKQRMSIGTETMRERQMSIRAFDLTAGKSEMDKSKRRQSDMTGLSMLAKTQPSPSVKKMSRRTSVM